MAKRVPKRPGTPKSPMGPNKAELLFWLIPAGIDLVVKAFEAAPRIWDAAAEMRERWRQRKMRRSTSSTGNGELRLQDESLERHGPEEVQNGHPHD